MENYKPADTVRTGQIMGYMTGQFMCCLLTHQKGEARARFAAGVEVVDKAQIGLGIRHAGARRQRRFSPADAGRENSE